eukprot:1575815-Amphidinium_carterae.1
MGLMWVARAVALVRRKNAKGAALGARRAKRMKAMRPHSRRSHSGQLRHSIELCREGGECGRRAQFL